MKRLRLDRFGRQLLSPRSRPCCLRTRSLAAPISNRSPYSTATAQSDIIYEEDASPEPPTQRHPSSPYPSPLPEAALSSAKLAALHARLALPKRLPLQTLARTLVDPSADHDPNFNNASMAQLGGAIMSYHVSEYLLCTYPRLPMSVLFAAAYAYNGPKTLQLIAKEWGVETAAVPGSEVDPGLLQFEKMRSGAPLFGSDVGSVRPDAFSFFRRGLSSRVVYDDEFGDVIPKEQDSTLPLPTETAYSNFVKAVLGALYLHAGQDLAKQFVKAHILSRHLEIGSLFQFKDPIRELARLCAREDFEYPIARLLSETGRRTRSPVFVVGIFSGTDKLGEGQGAALPEARIRAAVAALKSWYLYSPGKNLGVPSDMEGPSKRARKEWEPVYIDIGEVV